MSRKLVKSGPELWAECSDPGSLARHLGEFGEIRITKLEPETAVAWEGAAARGTVRLEPAGWGTRVTLTVSDERALNTPADPEPTEDPEPAVARASPVTDAAGPEAASAAEPEAAPAVESGAPPRPGPLARLLGRLRRRPDREPSAPEAGGAPSVTPMAATPRAAKPRAATPAAGPGTAQPGTPVTGEPLLTAALDSLGRAHRKPYSRG